MKEYKRGEEIVEAVKYDNNGNQVESLAGSAFKFESSDTTFCAILIGSQLCKCYKGMYLVKDSEGGLSIWKETNFNNVFTEL